MVNGIMENKEEGNSSYHQCVHTEPKAMFQPQGMVMVAIHLLRNSRSCVPLRSSYAQAQSSPQTKIARGSDSTSEQFSFSSGYDEHDGSWAAMHANKPGARIDFLCVIHTLASARKKKCCVAARL